MNKTKSAFKPALKKVKSFEINMARKAMVVFLALAILCCSLLTSCGESSEGEYTLYYTNINSSVLMEYSYTPKSSGAQGLALEFYNQMRDVDISNSYSTIPKGIECEKVLFEGGIVSLYITGNIDDMTSSERLIFASALTKAITQIPDVEGIRFYNDDEDITETFGKGNDTLKASDFVNNANDDSDDYVTQTISLYFGDEGKDNLVKTEKDVTYRSTTSIARVVVEELIKGPSESGLTRTVSSNVTVLSISEQGGVCYVNLSKEFITDPVTSFDMVPVYSIVNSLTELPNINSVQISINGDANASMPMGEISLTSAFSFNSEIVVK